MRFGKNILSCRKIKIFATNFSFKKYYIKEMCPTHLFFFTKIYNFAKIK